MTDFWLLEIRSGHLRTSTVSDVLPMGTLIESLACGGAGNQPAGAASRRLYRCRDERWKFARSGMFGSAQRGSTTVEALFDGSQIDARLSAAYSNEPIETLLSLTPDGSYSGTADVLTSCGWNGMPITAKAD